MNNRAIFREKNISLVAFTSFIHFNEIKFNEFKIYFMQWKIALDATPPFNYIEDYAIGVQVYMVCIRAWSLLYHATNKTKRRNMKFNHCKNFNGIKHQASLV